MSGKKPLPSKMCFYPSMALFKTSKADWDTCLTLKIIKVILMSKPLNANKIGFQECMEIEIHVQCSGNLRETKGYITLYMLETMLNVSHRCDL